MSKQKGFIKWEIHKNNDKSYTDIVYRESQEDAKDSEKNMNIIPNASDRFACYKQDSISSNGLHTIGSFVS